MAIQAVIYFVLLLRLKRFKLIRFSNVQADEALFSITFFRTGFSMQRVTF